MQQSIPAVFQHCSSLGSGICLPPGTLLRFNDKFISEDNKFLIDCIWEGHEVQCRFAEGKKMSDLLIVTILHTVLLNKLQYKMTFI